MLSLSPCTAAVAPILDEKSSPVTISELFTHLGLLMHPRNPSPSPPRHALPCCNCPDLERDLRARDND